MKHKLPIRVLINMPSQHNMQYSGVARVAFSILEVLTDNKDFHFTVRSPWNISTIPSALQNKGIDFVQIKRPKILIIDVILQLIRVSFYCKMNKIDVVMNMDPYGASLAATRIVVVHDLYFKLLRRGVSIRERITSNIIFIIMLFVNNVIVTVSEATAADLRRFYRWGNNKISTIHSAPTISYIDVSSFEASIHGKYILIVGNATPNKNFEVAAEAFVLLHQQYPNLRVVHVGVDKSEVIANILNKHFIGNKLDRKIGIDEQQLANLYSNAMCLCVPSFYEGFCLPVLEAQSMGCPLICSETPALVEVSGSKALFFNPYSAEDLSAKITKLLENTILRDRLIVAGKDNAVKFNWFKTAKKYEAILYACGAKKMVKKESQGDV